MDDVISLQAFKLKGRLYTLTVLHLFSSDLNLFAQQLADAIQKAPRLFEQSPIVLDCSALVEIPLDLVLCCQIMRQFGLQPVGIQNCSPLIQTAARNINLPLLNSSSQHDKPVQEPKTQVFDSRLSHTDAVKSKCYTTPIRSGQQIVSHGDLIVASSVSHGAELLAEGHIHVYGALRGRALAGITGDKQARIFCQALDAELVAIAGIYSLSDGIQAIEGPCQIFLKDDCIQIEPL